MYQNCAIFWRYNSSRGIWTPYTLRTLDHRPDSESQPQPLLFHLARKTPRFWYTLKSGPVGGRDSADARLKFNFLLKAELIRPRPRPPRLAALRRLAQPAEAAETWDCVSPITISTRPETRNAQSSA